MQNSKLSDFIKKEGLSPDNYNISQITDEFLNEMKSGLTDKPGSLAMLPTYITPPSEIPRNEKLVLIDAGGTNLRVTLLHFNEKLEPVTDYFEKYPMPGITSTLSKKEFFETIAGYVSPVIEKSDRAAFCFSYPAEITPTKDGILKMWTKEVKAPEVVGTHICKELREAIIAQKKKCGKMILLNDGIATLLAGATVHKCPTNGYIGFIVGTGTNTSCVIDNKDILKNGSNLVGNQCINIESGNFSHLTLSNVDKILHSMTKDPGAYTLEKMIGGVYMGNLTHILFKEATKEKLFSDKASFAINGLANLESQYLNPELIDNNSYPYESFSKEDGQVAKFLIDTIVERAAKVTAANLTATILRSGSQDICISADGSTYFKLPTFQQRVESKLRDELEGKVKNWSVVKVDSAPVVGACVAGLTN